MVLVHRSIVTAIETLTKDTVCCLFGVRVAVSCLIHIVAEDDHKVLILLLVPSNDGVIGLCGFTWRLMVKIQPRLRAS